MILAHFATFFRATVLRSDDRLCFTSKFSAQIGCGLISRMPIIPNGFLPPINRAAGKGWLHMWMTRKVAARILIWLVAATTPFQGISAAACDCNRDGECCLNQQASTCCCSAETEKSGGYCCSSRQSAATVRCCGQHGTCGDSSCDCGLQCPCRKARRPAPALPPIDTNSWDRLASDLAAPASDWEVRPDVHVRRQRDPFLIADREAVLDRCASLCRFTL